MLTIVSFSKKEAAIFGTYKIKTTFGHPKIGRPI
jgi:hypothetical protein